MTSEIRTNSLKSRAGLSTVTMTDSGPMFSGITTFVDNSGFTFGVGGGTSIFTPATNVLTFGTNNTEKVRIDGDGNANITGVTTAANFKTGVSNLHDVGLTLSGGQIDVGSNIKIGTAGVVTATSFVGDGSNLTGITGTTINNNANNRVITGSGTANTLEAESTLTFNGTELEIQPASAAPALFIGDSNRTGAGQGLVHFRGNWNGTTVARITIDTGGDTTNKDDGIIRFDTSSTGSLVERVRITSDGHFGIGDTTPAEILTIRDATPRIRLEDSDTTNAACQFVGDNASVLIQADTAGVVSNSTISFAIDGGEVSRFDSSGHLLIGTTDSHGSDADDIVIATSGTTGITIRSGTSGSGNIYFADGNSGTSLYRGRLSYYHGDDSLFLGTANANNSLKISSDGRIGLRHDLSGTADYNRMMIYNPNSGSCWIQLMSTATGNSANTDGLSIGLNTSNIAHIWQRENAEMQFATNNSLRWRITSSGDVYPQGNYSIGLNSNVAFRMNEVNSNKFVHRYGTSGSATNNQQEAIWYGGGITVMHDNATLQTTNYTWGLTGHRGYPLFRIRNSNQAAIYAESGSISSGSDYRMKENIEEITNGIETVKKLKPSKYNIRKSFNPLDDGKKHHGFIAHEVQEAIPDIGNIVSGTKDGMEEVFYGVDDDEVIPEGKKAGDSTGTFTDKPDMQGIDYGHMTPVLAAAIKELITKVETLEQDNIALRVRVTNLEGN